MDIEAARKNGFPCHKDVLDLCDEIERLREERTCYAEALDTIALAHTSLAEAVEHIRLAIIGTT